MTRHPTQLSFAFVAEKTQDTGSFVTTRALRAHRLCTSLLKKLHYVRRFFPELGGVTIRVGLTRVASGMAVPGGHELWFNPSHVSFHTIAHEFVHLLQGEDGVPSGERSCDVYSLARHWTLNDTPPFYVRIPREFLDIKGKIKPAHSRLIYVVAKRALEKRRAGVRHYIAYFEKTLERLKEQPQRIARSETLLSSTTGG